MSLGHRGILLVEDDEHDVFFMQRAMSKAGLEPPVHIAHNGQEAVDYLSGSGSYQDRSIYPLPLCVFLDLKLPFIHGFQILVWMREQSALKDINVVILTSSPEERDRQRARELGAVAYLVKPPTPGVLAELSRNFPEILARRKTDDVTD